MRTGLVNANVHEVIKPLGTLGLDIIQRPVDATAYRFPVYAHIFRHDAPREIYGKPANRQVKVTGKSASRISPGNIGCYNAMLRAFNAVSQIPRPLQGWLQSQGSSKYADDHSSGHNDGIAYDRTDNHPDAIYQSWPVS